jgi:hypothetical protein|uniref:Uncharacterized protein n=1 Tax=Picea glauca TaxID=3330 RepID=A0A117NGZ5_PICGL|nr:hypothetical protein ABT39_MTgene5744 [Picea glauca]QHR87669.1 hypothetical protein Q903MT_gene1681 [Picea sitchensis]
MIIKSQSFLKRYSYGRWLGFMETVSHITNMILAYEYIKGSPGLLTASIDGKTLSGISYNDLVHFFFVT